MKRKLKFKGFQIEDVARAAMHDGLILADEPGLGKTLQGLAWALIKHARRVLIVAPGGLHQQWRDDAQKHLGLHITRLPDVRTYRALGLDKPLRKDGETKTKFYITSYQDLGYNNADEWPENVSEDGNHSAGEDRVKARGLDPVFRQFQQLLAALNGKPFDPAPYFEGIGEEKNGIRCVWKPTLARVIAMSEVCGGGFDCVIVDEGTRLQANDAHIALGVRMLSPKYRIVLTGTPIKNRLESFFWLAWWACGGSPVPTARWPYPGDSEAREEFAQQHLQRDRFITREREAAGKYGGRKPIAQDIYDVLTTQTSRLNGGLAIPQVLDRRLYARVKQVIEDFGGRWCRKAQAHLFASTSHAQSGVYTVDSFLTAIVPIDPDAKAKRRIEKRSARICNIHRLWKLIAPIVLRRRKADCGEDIVKKTIKPIIIPPGTAQQAVYQYHLQHPPVMAKGGGGGKKLDARARIGMQLGILRQAALCPDAEALRDVITGNDTGPKRSWTDANPKQAAILSLCAELLDQGEQVLIGSPFRAFSEALHRRLCDAGVSSILLDGNTSQLRRGELAVDFKKQRYSVMVAGINAMGEGHSFANCARLILPSLSWAYDENEQFTHRVWRLDSERDVIIYTMVMKGSIDERLSTLFAEKGESAQLALDGELNENDVQQYDVSALLADAVRAFDPDAPTVDEQLIEAEWPALRKRLGYAEARFREHHPPIVASTPGVTADDMAGAVSALAIQSPNALSVQLARLRRKRDRQRS